MATHTIEVRRGDIVRVVMLDDDGGEYGVEVERRGLKLYACPFDDKLDLGEILAIFNADKAPDCEWRWEGYA